MSDRTTPKNLLLSGLLLYLISLASAPLAFGQATTGTISGVVLDQGGGTVPEAKVTVRNLDTNASRSVTTQEDGRFNLSALSVGRYEVTVARTGFARYVRGPIYLELNQVAIVNVELRAAGVNETVTVTQDAPMLNTTSAEVGVRFDEKRLTDLPLSGQFGNGGGFRDVFSVALSAAGVSQTNSGNATFTTGTNFSVNGMRLRGNNFMIDGQDSNDPSIAGRQQQINNPDIVQEFRLITNQFNAEYGRSAGSVVNVVTKSGTNGFHGSAFWYHNDNVLNSCTNLNKNSGLKDPRFCSSLAGGRGGAPFLIENQFGGTFGGPIWKDHTFFFGSLQRWTQRQLGSGFTLDGAPADAGRQLLQSTVGSRPQVAALLKYVPAGIPNGKTASFCTAGTLPSCTGGSKVDIPLGSLTGSVSTPFNNWQWSARIDHRFGKHELGGRYLHNDQVQAGGGQATPPGLTTSNTSRSQAMTFFVTSNVNPHTLNEARLSYQRLGSNTTPDDPGSLLIPSLEITELGMKGFNSGATRTAIGLAVNQPQFRFNNTYQIQDTVAWNHGRHAVKFGADVRRVDVKSFFFPTIRGLLRYSTLQNFVNDLAEAANINKALPGGSPIQYYKWYDYFFFVQDTWQIRPSFTLNYGLRYETPGSALASLYPVSDAIVQTNGGNSVFSLTPRPGRDTNNFQPRVGFSWNPRTRKDGILGHLTGGDSLVLRGGYSRTNDYTFINIALNVASSFPFVAAISNSNLAGAFATLPGQSPNLSGPPAPNCAVNPQAANCLTRTVLAGDFRSPIAEQFALELQRSVTSNTVLHVAYVGTKGTALFQTVDGNPRTNCSPMPFHRDAKTNKAIADGCPRVDPTRGVIRLRANSSSSIYHSLQLSVDKRLAHGLTAGAHYTWSAFIDDASEIFNPSTGEIAVSQDSFDRRADRGRSTYDRPHRFSANFVWELPLLRSQEGLVGHMLGGWQVSSFVTFQSGSPFTVLNGADPDLAVAGIDSLVGNSIRPNLNTTLNVSKVSIAELISAGGASLFQRLRSCQDLGATLVCPDRVGNSGRNIVRGNKLKDINLSIAKSTRIAEGHQIQFRADMFNMTNTRNFGIPNGDVTSASFLNEKNTDGGNRRIFLSLRYQF